MNTAGIKEIGKLFKEAGNNFARHHVIKLSASLAYFTVFTLGPMLMVIIFFSNLFWRKQAVKGVIYKRLKEFVGEGPATQIQEVLNNASLGEGKFTAVIGFVTLIIAATTVFTQIQGSLNLIWNLKVKSSRKWTQMLKNRLIAFLMMAGLGIMLLLSLIVNGLLEGFMRKLQEAFPDVGFALIYAANLLLTFTVVASLFVIIFKVLPDAIMQWKDVTVGALFTAALFMLGKFGITFYIQRSNMGSTYGSAGSLVILLLWIFYSSVVLYFGAEFTKAYALKYGREIRPRDYAVTIQVVEVESGEKTVQENEKRAKHAEEEAEKASKKSKGKN